MSRLNGKIAVVTGGSSGIGLEIARRFVAEGAFVFITGRRQDELDTAVVAIGGNIRAVQGDVTLAADLDRLFDTVRQEKGKLDTLVVNAGMIEPVLFPDVSEDHFDRTFGLNARAPVFTVQKAVPLMIDGGSIILIGSTAGYIGLAGGYSTYSATKAALRSYARTWTREFGDNGIRVNTLSPGPIETPVVETLSADAAADEAFRKHYTSIIPLKRFGRAEEVAGAALFLASDDSTFVAGAELSVDGGMSQV